MGNGPGWGSNFGCETPAAMPTLSSVAASPGDVALASNSTAVPPNATAVLPSPPPGPAPGTPDLPSLGSAQHGSDNCKPCAFFHADRCQSGPKCLFCHLCEAGEKRRRRKEKKLELRSVRKTC